MKKTFMSVLIVFVMLFSVACSSGDEYDSDEKESVSDGTGEVMSEEDAKLAKILDTISYDQIVVEIDEPDMDSNSEGRASVTAHIPNYTQIFMTVFDEADIDQAISDIVKNGKYTTVEYKDYATVTYDENGQLVIDSDEVVKEFIEKELIKAINAVTEAREE